MKQFTLSGQERLKSRKQIDLLFTQGNHLILFPLRVSYILFKQKQEEPLQFGVGVSSKWFKKAVDRNRVKRILRETWRVQKNGLKDALAVKQQHMIVFAVYTGKELPDHELVRQKMEQVIEKLSRIVDEAIEKNI